MICSFSSTLIQLKYSCQKSCRPLL